MNNTESDYANGFQQNAPCDIPSEETENRARPPTGPCLPGFEDVAAPPISDPLLRASARYNRHVGVAGQLFRSSLNGLASPRCFALMAATVLLIGLVFIAAYKFIRPRTVVREVVKEVRVEPDGVPLALLPDTADASVWNVVANMSGIIGGTRLSFTHGIARVNGAEYKVCLDFCRIGNDIYARIAGKTEWVVKVTPEGRIVKVYPAPKNKKPLKALFAR